MKNLRRRGALVATTAALALTIAACGNGGAENDTDAGTGTEENGGGADRPITIGIHNTWEEGIAVSELWRQLLEEQGYEVEGESAEAGVIYTAVAQGDYDFYMDAWLPLTHGSYMEEYGDRIDVLGTWLDEAPLTIAVNEDAPIDSLAELAENADEFGNRLVGIEAGAGLTEITQNAVIPTYGLEDMDYVISSTPAMLAELQSATDAGENVVVTLWRPHWAYAAFPIKDLEDPEGALGEPDEIQTVATDGFSEEFPEVAQWLADFHLTQDQLADLVNLAFNENDAADIESSVQEWREMYPEVEEGIIGG